MLLHVALMKGSSKWVFLTHAMSSARLRTDVVCIASTACDAVYKEPTTHVQKLYSLHSHQSYYTFSEKGQAGFSSNVYAEELMSPIVLCHRSI